MGFGKEIVGVSDYCNYPNATKRIQRIGGLEIKIENIISLKPTLILDMNEMNKRYELIFKQLGLNYINVNLKRLDDISYAAMQIAKILSAPEKGESFIKDWKKQKEALNLQPLQSQPKVYFEIWDTPTQAAGPNSFIGELISVAGGKNIVSGNNKFPVVNSETVITMNPDVILLSYPVKSTDSLRNRPGWDIIKAVKSNRIFILDQDLFVRPGPRNLEAIKKLNQIFRKIK
jgi:iron complex transport system substrate-binding protein